MQGELGFSTQVFLPHRKQSTTDVFDLRISEQLSPYLFLRGRPAIAYAPRLNAHLLAGIDLPWRIQEALRPEFAGHFRIVLAAVREVTGVVDGVLAALQHIFPDPGVLFGRG